MSAEEKSIYLAIDCPAALIKGDKGPRDSAKPHCSFQQDRARSIRMIVLDQSDRVLCTQNGNSIDILSGQQEWDDDTYEEAARREVEEQAGIRLSFISLVAVIKKFNGNTQTTLYELVLTGIAKDIQPQEETSSHNVIFISKEELLNRCSSGNPEALKSMINMAVNYRDITRDVNRNECQQGCKQREQGPFTHFINAGQFHSADRSQDKTKLL